MANVLKTFEKHPAETLDGIWRCYSKNLRSIMACDGGNDYHHKQAARNGGGRRWNKRRTTEKWYYRLFLLLRTARGPLDQCR